ncbi:MAG: hypothetical protein H6818_00405 [Phycisphaerales bacterium]|nr:hypothetical protein [Phycisphaerales bacterium]
MADILTGLSLLTVVAVIYGVNLKRSRRHGERAWPSGHPWSGLTISLLAIACLWRGFAGQAAASLGMVNVLAALSASCWIVDEIRRQWGPDRIR